MRRLPDDLGASNAALADAEKKAEAGTSSEQELQEQGAKLSEMAKELEEKEDELADLICDQVRSEPGFRSRFGSFRRALGCV